MNSVSISAFASTLPSTSCRIALNAGVGVGVRVAVGITVAATSVGVGESTFTVVWQLAQIGNQQ